MNRLDANHCLARAYPGGIDAVALRLGKPPDTVRKELTGVKGYKFGIDTEEHLMQICQAAGMHDALLPLTAAAVNMGALLIPLPRDDASGTTYKCLAEAAHEFGGFMSSAADAIADGKVTANELRNVEREFSELVAKGQSCVAQMAALYEAGKPAELRSVPSGSHQQAQAGS